MHVHVIYVQHGEIHYIEAPPSSARPGLELTTSGTLSPSTIPTACIYIEGDIATEYKLSVDSRLRLLRPGFLKTK